MMWSKAKWLKIPREEIERKKICHGDMTGRFAYFRCDLTLPEHASAQAEITANSRYRLWVNGEPVLSGPCKGDQHRQYYETVELTQYLRPGKNVLCAQVLYCDPNTAEIQTDERASIYGVIGQSCGHRFAMEADFLDGSDLVIASATTGTADWRVYLENSFFLKSTPVTEFLGAVVEEYDLRKTPCQWKSLDFDDSGWRLAEAVFDVLPTNPLYAAGVLPRFSLRSREIPLAYERKTRFIRDFQIPSGKAVGILDRGSITVPAHTAMEFILDAGAVQNGYPRYEFSGGSDAEVQITYFEKFGGQGSDLMRTDYLHGEVSGLTDVIRLPRGSAVYEPFWVRCFRFVRIRVQTASETLTVAAPTFRQTGYPLEVRSHLTSSELWVEKLWDICVRTLENCMLETYMDCPYYEQLQFAMDTRLEALYTYAVSPDVRLPRKALLDFHYGMLPDGLTPGKYPSAYLQVLSTFSLHYVMMLWEYYVQTGDASTVRLCRGDVDRILDYYDAHIGADGFVGRLGYWEFVDWQDQWNGSAGMPMALMSGPSTIINLMYAYALDCAAKLNTAFGRTGLCEEYRQRRQAILDKVQRYCWDDGRKMYREGPAYFQFTQHAQAWAVRNGLAQGDAARTILRNAIDSTDCLKCSFSTAYEWFRALEQVGMYEELRECINDWIGLLELDCTTCPETPHAARSDCHAWSALPMYEMMRTIAGVKNIGIGWDKVVIAPHMLDLPDVSGTVTTPKGDIAFAYTKTAYSLTIPEGMEAEFQYETGEKRMLAAGVQVLSKIESEFPG